MNLFKSIVTYHCPHCRKGKLFKSPFSFSDPLAMHEKCSHCGQDFEPEPGFYYGAMFISYGLSSLLLLIPSLILVLGYDWSMMKAMLLMLFLTAISFFKLLRLSRSLWIHIVVKYDPLAAGVGEKAKQAEA